MLATETCFSNQWSLSKIKYKPMKRIILKFRKRKYPETIFLLMSDGKSAFEARYRFNLSACIIADFNAINLHKQIHPDSYFVKNLVCTKPTTAGRTTLFNNKLVVKTESGKEEHILENVSQLESALTEYFGIQLKGKISYPLLTR
jgi:arylamine N-acetyltransferase